MKYIGIIILLVIPTFLSAHPGHGTGQGFEFIHMISSAIHAVPFILAAFFGLTAWNFLSRKSKIKE